MKKAALLIFSLALAGCVTAKPIQIPSGEAGYIIDCSSANGWGKCFEKAAETCGGPYEIINQSGGWLEARTLLIKCK